MREKLQTVTERVELSKLKAGRVLRVVTGNGEAAWTYHFEVQQEGKWPVGQLRAFSPDGELSGEGKFMLHGSGIWTTRQQNPVQTQNRAFTPNFGDLQLGSFLLGSNPDNPAERLVFDKPGQQITYLEVL
jgi:hypothetical protein